jgi:uncharacterized protein YggU (UPF0235/DUF167 family)
MYIRVNVIAGAKRELVKRISPDRYAISVRELPERNMANTRVKEVLAGELGLSVKAIRLISGHTSPHKIFSVKDTE